MGCIYVGFAGWDLTTLGTLYLAHTSAPMGWGREWGAGKVKPMDCDTSSLLIELKYSNRNEKGHDRKK